MLWFDEEDFKSVTGVEITIFPETRRERQYWSLHVRNTYTASWHDVSMMNKILIDSKKKFGGTISGDYGKDKVAPLWKDETSPMSRGVDYVSEKTHTNIAMIKASLPRPRNNFQAPIGSEIDEKMKDFLDYIDPTRHIYIGLVPMLVAIFEFYFKEMFRILLKYDNDILSRIKQSLPEYKDLDTPTIIDTFVGKINFQDLRNIRKAYKKHVGIDIKNIIENSEKTDDCYGKLKGLISYRHDIVHRLESGSMFSREDFLEFHKALEESIYRINHEIVVKYNLNVKDTITPAQPPLDHQDRKINYT